MEKQKHKRNCRYMQMMSFCKSTKSNGSKAGCKSPPRFCCVPAVSCEMRPLSASVVWIKMFGLFAPSATFILEAGCCFLTPEINIFFSVGEKTAREALVCINHFPCSRLQSSCCINLHVNEEGGRLLRLILHSSFT